MKGVRLVQGDCFKEMQLFDEGSVDAIVTDPPYGLEFMGKEWDSFNSAKGALTKPGIGDRRTEWPSGQGWNLRRCRTCGHLPHGGSPCQCKEPDLVSDVSRWHAFQVWCEQWATAALRVLKPAGYALIFGGTRTYHRLACAVEDAGFEIRDCIMWLYGSGFPKGKGCLKPAYEPILLCRKPGAKVLPLGIDECRVATEENLNGGAYAKQGTERHDGTENWRYKRDGGRGSLNNLQAAGPPTSSTMVAMRCWRRSRSSGMIKVMDAASQETENRRRTKRITGLAVVGLTTPRPTVTLALPLAFSIRRRQAGVSGEKVTTILQ